nr:MAG TPA_asm: hypothetical protein [Caudoviricetes sp.]
MRNRSRLLRRAVCQCPWGFLLEFLDTPPSVRYARIHLPFQGRRGKLCLILTLGVSSNILVPPERGLALSAAK